MIDNAYKYKYTCKYDLLFMLSLLTHDMDGFRSTER